MNTHPAFRLYGIFGYPLAHTLSPAMQEAAFEASGIKAYYLTLEMELKSFRKTLSGLDRFLLDGFNVTVPYKEAVLPYLDALTPQARHVGAVNTVFKKGRKWWGTNTDVDGFLKSLAVEARFRPLGKSAVVLGAGGAARAVVYGLAREGMREIVITNRHVERAEKLRENFGKLFRKTRIYAVASREDELAEPLAHADLVVNATSLGLKAGDGLPLPEASIPDKQRKKALYCDLIYRPALTPFLAAAEHRGHRTLGGLGMLLFQGAAAFECWTGKKAPISIMRRALEDALQGRA